MTETDQVLTKIDEEIADTVSEKSLARLRVKYNLSVDAKPSEILKAISVSPDVPEGMRDACRWFDKIG